MKEQPVEMYLSVSTSHEKPSIKKNYLLAKRYPNQPIHKIIRNANLRGMRYNRSFLS